MDVLVANHLQKTFGTLTAVDGISLSLQAGTCLALLGPNGAGKTTTVEMLEGLLEPSAGTVTILGQHYKTDKRSIYARIGVALQETRLYKKFTVKETFELFASFYAKSTPIDELLTMLELTDKRDTRLEALSGGQKQRVYLGCALVHNPEILFLDEPTTGLDPQARHFVWELLKQRKKSGTAILLTTHYMEEAQLLADNVIIMDHGKIIASGTPQDLIKAHAPEQPRLVQVQEGTLEDVFMKLTGRSLRDA